jgi:hypothetical protein
LVLAQRLILMDEHCAIGRLDVLDVVVVFSVDQSLQVVPLPALVVVAVAAPTFRERTPVTQPPPGGRWALGPHVHHDLALDRRADSHHLVAAQRAALGTWLSLLEWQIGGLVK